MVLVIAGGCEDGYRHPWEKVYTVGSLLNKTGDNCTYGTLRFVVGERLIGVEDSCFNEICAHDRVSGTDAVGYLHLCLWRE